MFMKKNLIRGIIVVVILFIVFNVLCFAIPFQRTAPFWLAYIFGSISILVQLFFVYIAFFKENTPKSRFYGFPIAQVGNVYLIAQVILSFLTMILGDLIPVWLVIIVYVVVLAGAAIGFVGVDAVRDEVERQDKVVEKSTDSMRSLQASANTLADLCTDKELSTIVKKFVEELKYSDPVSNSNTKDKEAELEEVLADLKSAMIGSDKDAAEQLCKKAMLVLAERNRICRLNK